jgi:hypothetical protein
MRAAYNTFFSHDTTANNNLIISINLIHSRLAATLTPIIIVLHTTVY